LNSNLDNNEYRYLKKDIFGYESGYVYFFIGYEYEYGFNLELNTDNYPDPDKKIIIFFF
jgi:hypothetical protein